MKEPCEDVRLVCERPCDSRRGRESDPPPTTPPPLSPFPPLPLLPRQESGRPPRRGSKAPRSPRGCARREGDDLAGAGASVRRRCPAALARSRQLARGTRARRRTSLVQPTPTPSSRRMTRSSNSPTVRPGSTPSRRPAPQLRFTSSALADRISASALRRPRGPADLVGAGVEGPATSRPPSAMTRASSPVRMTSASLIASERPRAPVDAGDQGVESGRDLGGAFRRALLQRAKLGVDDSDRLACTFPPRPPQGPGRDP